MGTTPEAIAPNRATRPSRLSSESTPRVREVKCGGARSRVQHSGLTSSFKSIKRYAEYTVNYFDGKVSARAHVRSGAAESRRPRARATRAQIRSGCVHDH